MHKTLPFGKCRLAIHHHTTNVQDAGEQLENHTGNTNPKAGALVLDEIQLEPLFDCVLIHIVFHPDPERIAICYHYYDFMITSHYPFTIKTIKAITNKKNSFPCHCVSTKLALLRSLSKWFLRTKHDCFAEQFFVSQLFRRWQTQYFLHFLCHM